RTVPGPQQQRAQIVNRAPNVRTLRAQGIERLPPRGIGGERREGRIVRIGIVDIEPHGHDLRAAWGERHAPGQPGREVAARR
ncbi:hypothetical protein ACSTHP_00380, partial [Vibrio parahaemolyticus]